MFKDYDVEEVVARLPLDDLKDKGNYYLAKCPYHDDNNPSFSIVKQGDFKGLCKCWSCDTIKSIFKVYRELTGNNLIDDFNLYTSKLNYFFKKDEIKKEKKRRTPEGILYTGKLESPYNNQDLIDHFSSRRIYKDFIDYFQIKYTENIYVNNKSNYKDRFIIPIFDEKGSLVSLEARAYKKNSGTKVLYPKGTSVDYLFNYDNINKNEMVYVTEGIMGLSSIWQYVSKNVVSTFSKNITSRQKTLISKLKKICIIPDNDDKLVNGELIKKNNLENTMNVYEEFYEYEYHLYNITQLDSDPNDLSIDELKNIPNNIISSGDYLMNKYNILQKQEVIW